MDKEAAIAKLENSLSKKSLLIDSICSALFCGIFFGAFYFFGPEGNWRRALIMGIPFGMAMGLGAPVLTT